MKETIKVAIIGCGWAGHRHAQAFVKAGAKICWAVDIIRKRAESLSNLQEKINITTDYKRALDDPEVDAVDICLPHNLHAPVAVAAAQAGKHILCEKPLAASLEEADQMIQAAKKRGVILMVAENVRFSPFYQKVHEFIQDGVIGKPALIQITRQAYLVKSFLEERPWFLNRKAAAGGIMMSGGVHDFEIMRMLIGEIESVYALQAPQRFLQMEGDDTSVALVQFKNGCVGVLVESFIMKDLVTATGSEIHTLRVDGDLGSISVKAGEPIYLFSEREDMRVEGEIVQHTIHVPDLDTFFLEIEHFIHCIRTGKKPITSGQSQRRPLEVVLAAYKSMESGKPVKVS